MLTSESDLVVYHCRGSQALSPHCLHIHNPRTSVLINTFSASDNNLMEWSSAGNRKITAHKTKLCVGWSQAYFGGDLD